MNKPSLFLIYNILTMSKLTLCCNHHNVLLYSSHLKENNKKSSNIILFSLIFSWKLTKLDAIFNYFRQISLYFVYLLKIVSSNFSFCQNHQFKRQWIFFRHILTILSPPLSHASQRILPQYHLPDSTARAFSRHRKLWYFICFFGRHEI